MYDYFAGFYQKKNVTFARNFLMTRLQAQNQSISWYVYILCALAKECSFQIVSAKRYKDDMNRDAFINGFQFYTTRRRLLEDETSDFETAIKKS